MVYAKCCVVCQCTCHNSEAVDTILPMLCALGPLLLTTQGDVTSRASLGWSLEFLVSPCYKHRELTV